MPIIPQYQPGQVGSDNLPGVRVNADGATPEAFGAGVAKSIGQIGDVVQKYADQQKQEADTTAVMAAENTLREHQNTLMFDPSAGALAQHGQDALAGPEKYLPQYDKKYAEILGGLNPDQQKTFSMRTGMWRSQMQGDLLRHASGEFSNLQDITEKAHVQSATETAALNANNPDRINSGAEDVQNTTMHTMNRLGIKGEAATLAISDALSHYYTGVAEHIAVVNGDSLGAQAFVDAHAASMNEVDKKTMALKLETSVKYQQATNIARDLLSGHTPGASGATDFNSADAIVAKTEGGLSHDPTDRGGVTKYGISQKAHPEVDVASLTPEQGRVIRKTYWDAIGADSLPPAIRGQAYDAAINQGVTWTKSALEKAGNDPEKFAALRIEKYNAVVAKDPSQKGHLDQWIARVQSSGGSAQGSIGTPRSVNEARQIAIATTPADLLPHVLSMLDHADAVAKQQSAEVDKTTEESIFYAVEASDAHKTVQSVLTPSQNNYAASHGIMGRLEERQSKRMAGTPVASDPQTVGMIDELLHKAAMGEADAMNKAMDLNPYNMKLPLSNDDRKRIGDTQEKLKGGGEKAMQLATEAQQIDRMASRLGIDGKDKTALHAFNAAYGDELTMWAQDNPGKTPTSADRQKLMDTITINAITPGGKIPLFMAIDQMNITDDEIAKSNAALRAAGYKHATDLQVRADALMRRNKK